MKSRSPGSLSNSPLQEVLQRLRVVKGPGARGEFIAWCPFHADGQGSPPHQPNLNVSERGYICHACGAKGGLRLLAERLGVTVSREVSADPVTYEYHDRDGNLLYQVVRLPGKRFFQRRPDGRGGWTNDLRGVRRVLYRVPELLKRAEESVFVVEGEKDADRLHAAGLLATTNSGGAGKWHDEYSRVLAGRDVIILPDNDQPGRQHAEAVAMSLSGKARTIKVVTLPGLDPKGDISDFLSRGKTAVDLEKIVSGTESWAPGASFSNNPHMDDDMASSPSAAGDKRGPSLATVIVQLAEQEGLEFFHDERGTGYTRLEIAGRRRIIPVAGRELETFLGRLAWRRTGKAAGSEAIRAARGVLEGKAMYEGPLHPLHCRLARVGEEIWIDLDGARAVKVIPGNWEVIDEPQILFRPNPHNRPLPEPIRGGDAHALLNFTRIEDKQVALLLIVFLIAAMYPDIPCPLLIVHGVQGAAKSTLLRLIKRLIDPHEVEIRGLPSDAGEYALTAWLNRCLAFDNLTTIPQWLSDALCRTVTGDGLEKRKLYSDDTPIVLKFKRVLLLAGINLVAQNPDLLDRSIIIELAPIQQERRRPETEFWEEFDRAAPAIFGGMLDALARVLKILPTVRLDKYPRMADFARIGSAAAVALGNTQDDFLEAYAKNSRRQSDAAMETSVVAQTLLDLMDGREEWSGTAADLLGQLEAVAEGLHINTKDRSWPKSPNILSRRLKELEPPLRARGLEVVHTRTGSQRIVTITKLLAPARIHATALQSSMATSVTEVTVHDDDDFGAVIDPQPGLPGISGGNDDDDDVLRLLEEMNYLPDQPGDWGMALQYQFRQRLARHLKTGMAQADAYAAARLEIVALWNAVMGQREA